MTRILRISSGVAQIVQRVLSDQIFRDDALANPELAFAHYSLDEEERQAIKNWLGHLGRHDSSFLKTAEFSFWAP